MAIQVTQHETLKALAAEKYAMLQYRAIPMQRFNLNILQTIYEAFGQEPMHSYPDDQGQRETLLQKIESRCFKRQWIFSPDFFVLTEFGNGQLLEELDKNHIHDINEQRDMAKSLIQQYPNIVCILDTDVMPPEAGQMISQDLTEPSQPPSNTDRSEPVTVATELDFDNNLFGVGSKVQQLEKSLEETRRFQMTQAEQLRKQEDFWNQIRAEFADLKTKIEARKPESEEPHRQHSNLHVDLNNQQMLGEHVTLTPPLSEDDQCQMPDESINQSLIRPASRVSRGSNSDRNGSLRNTNHMQTNNSRHIPLQHGEHRIKKRPKRRKLPLEGRELQDPTISSTTSPSRGDQEIRRPYKAWTLKMLNIKQYNPDITDISTHVETVTRVLEQMDVRPESQKIRLLVASLPDSHSHFERAVSQKRRKKFRLFSQELVNIMGTKVRVASDRFMQCHRNRGEDILRFFFRLCDLYKSSKGIMGDEWQDESVHTSHVYTKLYESLYQDERFMLERKLDHQLEKGNLTIHRIKKELIEINKMAQDKIAAETSSRHALLYLNDTYEERRQQSENEDQQPVEEETGEIIMQFTGTENSSDSSNEE